MNKSKLRTHVLRGFKKGPMKELAEELLNRGLRMKITGHNGVMVYPTDRNQSPVTLSMTASDHRAAANARTQCRRAGIDV